MLVLNASMLWRGGDVCVYFPPTQQREGEREREREREITEVRTYTYLPHSTPSSQDLKIR